MNYNVELFLEIFVPIAYTIVTVMGIMIIYIINDPDLYLPRMYTIIPAIHYHSPKWINDKLLQLNLYTPIHDGLYMLCFIIVKILLSIYTLLIAWILPVAVIVMPLCALIFGGIYLFVWSLWQYCCNYKIVEEQIAVSPPIEEHVIELNNVNHYCTVCTTSGTNHHTIITDRPLDLNVNLNHEV